MPGCTNAALPEGSKRKMFATVVMTRPHDRKPSCATRYKVGSDRHHAEYRERSTKDACAQVADEEYVGCDVARCTRRSLGPAAGG
jgi:hypothetical protein